MEATISTETRVTWSVAAGVAKPPQDRTIRIVACVILSDDWVTWSEPYEGLARWDERCRDWLDERGMSIRGVYESELIIHEWRELNECRQFILKRRYDARDEVQRLAPRRPVLAALPAPAWHTCASDKSYESRDAFRAELGKLTDAELCALREGQRRWFRFWFDGASARLHWREGAAFRERAQTVEQCIEWEIVSRFENIVRQRDLALHKARLMRKYRAEEKARAV